jgi:hypothetical protein
VIGRGGIETAGEVVESCFVQCGWVDDEHARSSL